MGTVVQGSKMLLIYTPFGHRETSKQSVTAIASKILVSVASYHCACPVAHHMIILENGFWVWGSIWGFYFLLPRIG